MSAIVVTSASHRYGRVEALKNVSISIEPGAIFGLLGPNGAGKSTLIRILCGLQAPTSGAATVLGCDTVRDATRVRRRIGYVSQQFAQYSDLTVHENLDFAAGIRGLSSTRRPVRIRELVSVLGLKGVLDRRAGALSGGYKQRLALAVALVHEPPVLFLDEPTAGVDPVARRELWDLLFDLSSMGVTMLVTTHYMDEAERCTALGYLSDGELLVVGRPAALKALPELHPEGTLRVTVECSKPTECLRALRGVSFVRHATMFGAEIHVLGDFESLDQAAEALRAVTHEDGVEIHAVRPLKPSLEDVFVTLCRARLAEGATV